MITKRDIQAGRLPFLLLFILFALFMVNTGYSQNAETYPKPLDEAVEQTSSNTITILGYPKYYRDDEKVLRETVTTLVRSDDSNWDYQVTTGIWHLYIRNDGYFQAQHKGDIFTYRLNSLGYGRGSGFRSVDLGSPDFSRMEVNGDTVRWSNVFADVDLVVRYIHDIMKVDVILRSSFMRDLRAVAGNGQLDPDDYLTARFDIDLVNIASEASQGGQPRDLYAESLNLDQPLTFEQDGEMVHRLRPVETYLLDNNGKRVDEFDNSRNQVRSAQTWQLKPNAPGIAELSANIGDLANLPDGDVAIDPSAVFSAYNTDTMDAELAFQSSTDLGGQTTMPLSYQDHAVIVADVSSIGSDKEVVDVKLNMYVSANSTLTNAQIRAYNADQDWWEAYVDWYEYDNGVGEDWSTAGGDFLMSDPGAVCTILSATTGWVKIDLTAPFNARYPSALSDIINQGYLLKFENNPLGTVTFISKDYTTDITKRWNMEILYFEGEGRTQGTYHYPMLLRRDGDPDDPDDRWFPIGSYFNVLAATNGHPTGSWTNIEKLSGEDYGDLYNCFNAIGGKDERGKVTGGTTLDVVYVQSYENMLDAMDDAATANGVDYSMIPMITYIVKEPDIVNSYPWDIFSHASYYPSSFSWANEIDEVEEVVLATRAHNRLRGWHLSDEPFGGITALCAETSSPCHPQYHPINNPNPTPYAGFREHIHDRIETFIDNSIAPNDTSYLHPYYINLRGYGNYYDGYDTGDTLNEIPAAWLDDLDIQDFIWDSSLYYLDIVKHPDSQNPSNKRWQDGVFYAESVMQEVIPEGYSNGYCRWLQSKDLGSYTLTSIDFEKYRYLAYSSWVAGGQGCLLFRMDDGSTGRKWIEQDPLEMDPPIPIATRIVEEAYEMQDWLMDEPATDIPAYIYDSDGNSRVRFILRRNQWGTDSRILLLFCNFANDSASHTTYIYFPDHVVTNAEKVKSHMNGAYSIENGGKVVRFDPTSMSSTDVYGSACFLTLSQ